MTVGDVALAGGVAAPTATRMLATLEREGIVRAQAFGDRPPPGAGHASPPRAQRSWPRSEAVIAEKQRQVFSMLSETEREQAEHILRRLAGAIEEL